MLTSVTVEALAIAVLVAIPIWHPDVLAAVPPRVVYPFPYARSNPDLPPDVHPSHGYGGSGPRVHNRLTAVIRSLDPSHNGLHDPNLKAQHTGDDSAPGIPGPRLTEDVNFIPLNSKPALPTLAKKPAPLIVSHYDPGSIIRQVTPDYPATARVARVQGEVVLQAIVTRAGTVEKVTVVRGNPLLVDAAVNAVRQWRFRPYMLNGQAVEIETMITVNFRLDGDGGAL